MISKILLCFFLFSIEVFAAPLKVVTTLPDLAEIARDLGGSQVEVQSLLKGSVDPHFADASPSFIQALSKADLLVSMGLELEIGWLPKVIERSNNPRIQVSAPGYFEAGTSVQVLDRPTGVLDRSMGDVHAQGNPHFNLSPRALTEVSEGLCNKLIELRPESKALFLANKLTFQNKMKSLQAEIEKILQPAKAKASLLIIEYHREFTYFLDLYGLKRFGSIEEKPGSPPSAGRLQDITTQSKKQHVSMAIAATFSPEKQLNRYSELSGVPFIVEPSYVSEKGAANSIEALQKQIATAIVTESHKVK